MKSVPKLIRKFVGVLLVSMVLLLVLNLAVFISVGSRQTASGSPYTMADEIGAALQKDETGYFLDEEHRKALEEAAAWALRVDNETHTVTWHTGDLPDGLPLTYSLSDISDLTLGYLRDCPTYVGDTEGGIVVLGYPPNRYWKSMWPTWDYEFIATLPQTVLTALLCNLALVFLIYLVVTGALIRSVNPLIAGIQNLTGETQIKVRETGVFSELAFHINQTAAKLEEQERQLAKKETAQANWIAGVSHDIRTPLSMVMGYGDQLREDTGLPPDARRKANLIVGQSERIRDLVRDLNLASKLEYNMQPLHLEGQNLVAVARQVTADFLNLNMDEKYAFFWDTDEKLTVCPVNIDKALIRRALSNLIQNSMNHNAQGCHIHIRVAAEGAVCLVTVADDGIGATEEQIDALNHAPHYMVCDENTDQQRHGLGLLIVRQIILAHSGKMEIKRSRYGGFEAELRLPKAI